MEKIRSTLSGRAVGDSSPATGQRGVGPASRRRPDFAEAEIPPATPVLAGLAGLAWSGLQVGLCAAAAQWKRFSPATKTGTAGKHGKPSGNLQKSKNIKPGKSG